MPITILKPLFKGPKAKPEVTRQGVRAQLSSFIYDFGSVAQTPSDLTFMIGAGSVYIHQDKIDFAETLVNLASGTYQTSAFTVGFTRKLLFTINQSGTLVKYEGVAVPVSPVSPPLPQKEKPICLVTVVSTVNTPGGIAVVAQPDIQQLNFSDNRRSTYVVATFAALASIINPQSGDVAFAEDRHEFYFYNSTTPGWQRVGNSVSGRVSIPSAATSLTVTFAQAFLTTSYIVVPCFFNDTDVLVQYQPLTVIAQTMNGFTVSWNAPTDSANYKLQYITSSATT